jgi:EAL domain-containing protein (putative c-di-GMP-specific phosphodiesterase class I)
LNEACRQVAKWQKRTVRPLSVSVNLSAKQLMHPDLVSRLAIMLANNGLEPRHLKLEVTESIVMEHSERSLSVLNELSAMGISLSTDDFGTGYSSLSYLQRFPFDRLKIDRSFIDRMLADEKSSAIVKTILMLGENLGIDVVAEGIEKKQQLERLISEGCRLGQGFLLSQPVDAAKAGRFLKARRSKKVSVFASELPSSAPILEVPNIQ